MFINFFAWNNVPAPETDEQPIPIYGKKHYKEKEEENDKYIINLALNPAVLEMYGKEAKKVEDREMLIGLAFKFVENQNEIKLDCDEYEVLKSRIFYGDIENCLSDLRGKRVKRGESDDKLEMAKEAMDYLRESGNDSLLPDNILSKLTSIDLKSGGEPKESAKPLIQEIDDSIAKYDHRIMKSKRDDNDFVYDLRIYLPKINSIDECILNVDKNYVTLNMNNNLYKQLEIPLNDLESDYVIHADRVEAKFVRKEKYLSVKIHLAMRK